MLRRLYRGCSSLGSAGASLSRRSLLAIPTADRISPRRSLRGSLFLGADDGLAPLATAIAIIVDAVDSSPEG